MKLSACQVVALGGPLIFAAYRPGLAARPSTPLMQLRAALAQRLGHPVREGAFVCSLELAVEVERRTRALATAFGTVALLPSWVAHSSPRIDLNLKPLEVRIYDVPTVKEAFKLKKLVQRRAMALTYSPSNTTGPWSEHQMLRDGGGLPQSLNGLTGAREVGANTLPSRRTPCPRAPNSAR